MTIQAPLVDAFLPEYDIETSSAVSVAASPAAVYPVARQLDMSSLRITRALFRLRGLPPSALNAEGLRRIRFKPLCEVIPHGFVLGIIGQFWTLSGRLVDFDPTEFAAFSTPGYAKATWSFDLASEGSGSTILRTVTRVRCLDPMARRRFRWYWRIVHPFSNVIRSQLLKSIKSAAEHGEALRGSA